MAATTENVAQDSAKEGLSVSQWLKSEQLDCLIPKFESYPVKLSFEDFADFTEEDVREQDNKQGRHPLQKKKKKSDLCKELGLQAGERVRLLKAVKKLPNSRCLQSTRVVHVFLGPEERQIMEKLHTTHDQAVSSIQILEARMQLLELSAKKCDVQIRMTFDQLSKSLFAFHQKLLQDVDTTKKTKSTPIEDLIEKHKKDLTQLSKAKEEFKNIVSNSNINSVTRTQKLEELQKNLPKYDHVITIPALCAQSNDRSKKKMDKQMAVNDGNKRQEIKMNIDKSEKDDDDNNNNNNNNNNDNETMVIGNGEEKEEKIETDKNKDRNKDKEEEKYEKEQRSDECIDEQAKKPLIGVVFDKTHWNESLKEHLQISATNSYRILTFGPRFPESEVVLSHNNTIAMRRLDIKNGHCYVIAEDNPVYQGAHCWRIRTHNPMTGLGWVMWGICQANRRYKSYSCRDPCVWGMAPMNYYYGSKELIYDKTIKNDHFKQKDICVDMHLDLSSGQLRFVIVDFDKSNHPEVVLRGIPRNNTNGWVPHFNIHTSGLWIRVAKIPPRWYGRGLKRIPEFVENLNSS
ncbi:structural maintenance of chromosome protein [Reticulomyxa filosa]|uniref:Structural maintenance of chromosome protein n=1 Tax=Reticulomyxa filosa TaxID=46433 RepID=X6NQ53_RETFI|nr:structural maintenance of chromosome protein [Reticulomyxa filosa]|eukprot:ETO28395.1 structural maintenance of chromosome protein [Reticulomyxa filosa]